MSLAIKLCYRFDSADKVVVSTSCSLLHTAVDLVNETKLDQEIKSWLAFAAQKVVEVNALAKALSGQKDEVLHSRNCCFALVLLFELLKTIQFFSFNKVLLASLLLYILPIKLVKILWTSDKHSLKDLNLWFSINFIHLLKLCILWKSISFFFFSPVKPDDIGH